MIKVFPYITISTGSSWPRIRKYRGKQNKNDVYFGPFANVNVVDQVLHQLEKSFFVRSCSDNFLIQEKGHVFYIRLKDVVLHAQVKLININIWTW